MVLGTCAGGVVAGHTPTQFRSSGERGSQALEFAMVMPLFGLLLVLLAQTGLLLADVVAAHGIVREVARTAAVDGEAAAKQLGDELAGRRDVRLDISDRDGLVDVRLEMRSAAFAGARADLWLPARAVMRREGVAADGAGPGP